MENISNQPIDPSVGSKRAREAGQAPTSRAAITRAKGRKEMTTQPPFAVQSSQTVALVVSKERRDDSRSPTIGQNHAGDLESSIATNNFCCNNNGSTKISILSLPEKILRDILEFTLPKRECQRFEWIGVLSGTCRLFRVAQRFAPKSFMLSDYIYYKTIMRPRYFAARVVG